MKTITVFAQEMKFANEELFKAYEIAKEAGYRVYTFKPSGDTISQIMISNGKTFGSVSKSYGGVSYGTCHKPTRGIGSGFGISGQIDCEIATLEKINEIFIYAPKWVSASDRRLVIKQTIDQMIDSDKILTWSEI